MLRANGKPDFGVLSRRATVLDAAHGEAHRRPPDFYRPTAFDHKKAPHKHEARYSAPDDTRFAFLCSTLLARLGRPADHSSSRPLVQIPIMARPPHTRPRLVHFFFRAPSSSFSKASSWLRHFCFLKCPSITEGSEKARVRSAWLKIDTVRSFSRSCDHNAG